MMPRPQRQQRHYGRRLVAAAVWLLTPGISVWAASDPFVDAIVSFAPGAHTNGETQSAVLGPPMGTGDLQGSTDTLSLGDGGSVVVRFDPPAICDGPGPDFVVFENAFHAGSASGPIFVEVGIVAVSDDGTQFAEFPYDPVTFVGLAGQTPVFSNPSNGIDPTDPAVAGGDAFDLATVGLASARFVRITDPGAAIPDPGNRVVPGPTGGFDLDAIVAIHVCSDTPPTSTPTATPIPTLSPPSTATMAVFDTPTRTPPPTFSPTAPAATVTPEELSPTPTISHAIVTATATAAVTRTPLQGDVNGDGRIGEADLIAVVEAVFTDGLERTADANHDSRVSAADLTRVIEVWSE